MQLMHITATGSNESGYFEFLFLWMSHYKLRCPRGTFYIPLSKNSPVEPYIYGDLKPGSFIF